METTRITVICKIFILLFKSQNSYFVLKSSFDIRKNSVNLVNSRLNYRVFAEFFIHTNVNSSHTFIVFLILNSWETDLQKLIDFLLNPFFVFRNELYVNLLYYMYTCCYSKIKLKFKLEQRRINVDVWRQNNVVSTSMTTLIRRCLF